MIFLSAPKTPRAYQQSNHNQRNIAPFRPADPETQHHGIHTIGDYTESNFDIPTSSKTKTNKLFAKSAPYARSRLCVYTSRATMTTPSRTLAAYWGACHHRASRKASDNWCYPYPHRLLSSHRRHYTSRQTPDLNTGFTGSYDPTVDSGRGPMFNKTNFGVPQFYPRDLKKRVDAYVVGQDRAKKTICSTIFNHYQALRRRHQHDHEERNMQQKLARQKFAREREIHQRRREPHPVEGQYILRQLMSLRHH